MGNEDVRIYNPELGLDGTLKELIDWSYRYDSDFSDEALDEIARQAVEFGIPENKARIPVLVKMARQREEKHDGSLPYEQMQLDKLVYDKISYSETKEYGEVGIYEEGEKVLFQFQALAAKALL